MTAPLHAFGGTEGAVAAKGRQYAARGVTLSAQEAMDEIAADFTREMLYHIELFRDLVRQDRSLAKWVMDGLTDFIRRVKNAFSGQTAREGGAGNEYGATLSALEEAALLWQAAYDAAAEEVQQHTNQAQENAAQEGGEARFSIQYDQDNTPYVVIEEDILAGVPRNRWIDAVKDTLKKKFPNGVHVGNNGIKINSQTRREMTFSEYTKWLARNKPGVYADKFRAANYADEIILASRDYINEGLKHERKDNIQDFARGTVQLRVGETDYSADVVVGTTASGSMLLYDIVNLQPTTIQEKSRRTVQPNQSEGRRSGTPTSDTSIAETGGDVNGRFSLKATDSEGRQLSAAQRELDMDRIRDAAESSGFGESGKRALTAAYDGEPEAAAYFAGFSVLYHAGLTGVEEGKVKSPYISPLTPAQRYAAYTAGQNDAPVSLNREKDGAAYGPVRSEEAGLVACFLGGRQKSQPGGHEVPGCFTFHDWHHQHRGFP